MGRRPDPTNLKIVRGTFRSDRAPAAEPKTGARTTAPSFLTPLARTEWRRCARYLEPLGLLTALDRVPFTIYCEAWSDYVAALASIAEHGIVLKDDRGRYHRNPAVIVRKQAIDDLLRIAREFGMTPAARTRIEAIERDAQNEHDAQHFGV